MEEAINKSIFSEATINEVWNKGTIVPNFEPTRFRKDFCGAWMIREAYGQNNNMYGWEIDYVLPLSNGGTEDITNLQPMQSTNNRNKRENYPNWNCKVTSNDNINVEIPI